MMSRSTLLLFVALAIASIAWSFITLYATATQYRHRDLIATMLANKTPLAIADVNASIADIEHTMHIAACNIPLSNQLMLLLVYSTDLHLHMGGLLEADDALEEAHAAMENHLSCAPRDGKAWLDFAMIQVQREGFSDAANYAYAMSARVAPGESWLAQKRLDFAVKFQPIMTASAKKIALRDIAVLQLAHPIRMQAVLKRAALKTPDELTALFQ